MFCSSKGVVCIDNSETILNILPLTMQIDENIYDNIVEDCSSEDIAYDLVLNHTTEKTITGMIIEKPNS